MRQNHAGFRTACPGKLIEVPEVGGLRSVPVISEKSTITLRAFVHPECRPRAGKNLRWPPRTGYSRRPDTVQYAILADSLKGIDSIDVSRRKRDRRWF